MHLEELTVAYAERTREGPAREHIERECNTIWATIAHQFRPRMKPPMWPTRRDRLKRMAAAITGTNARPADLSEAQYRKSRRAKVWEAFEERWKREWEKYQSTLTHHTTAQAEPWNKTVYKCHTRLTKVESMINTLLRTEHIGLNRYLYH